MSKINVSHIKTHDRTIKSTSITNKTTFHLNLAKIDVKSTKFTNDIAKSIIGKNRSLTTRDSSAYKIGFKNIKKDVSNNNYSMIQNPKDTRFQSECKFKSSYYTLEISPNRVDSCRVSKNLKNEKETPISKKNNSTKVNENTLKESLDPSTTNINIKLGITNTKNIKNNKSKPQMTCNTNEICSISPASKPRELLFDPKQTDLTLSDISDKAKSKINVNIYYHGSDRNTLTVKKISKEIPKIFQSNSNSSRNNKNDKFIEKKEIKLPISIEKKTSTIPSDTERIENNLIKTYNNVTNMSNSKLDGNMNKIGNDQNQTIISDFNEQRDKPNNIKITPLKFCSFDLIDCDEQQFKSPSENMLNDMNKLDTPKKLKNHRVKSDSHSCNFMNKSQIESHDENHNNMRQSVNLTHLSIPCERREQSLNRINFQLSNSKSHSNLISEKNENSAMPERLTNNLHIFKEYLNVTPNRYKDIITKYIESGDIEKVENKRPPLEINFDYTAAEAPMLSDYLTPKLPEMIDFFNPLPTYQQFEYQNLFSGGERNVDNDDLIQTYTFDASILPQVMSQHKQISHMDQVNQGNPVNDNHEIFLQNDISAIIPVSMTKKIYCFPNWDQNNSIDILADDAPLITENNDVLESIALKKEYVN